MRLAIVHYHLRRGGVTKVISSALQALGDRYRDAVVLSSTAPEEPMSCPCVIIPELAYDEEASTDSVDTLYEAITRAARDSLGGDPDLWHIHNHCLGKNVNFPPALKRLLDEGNRALLQIHDFSEDGRSANYTAQQTPFTKGIFAEYDTNLYPVAPQVGYAVLNGRDRDILEKAGIPTEQVHWLPNAVGTPSITQAPATLQGERPLILYPTRGIRRKNLGELILLSIMRPEFRFGTTLAPKNPQWFPIYEGWLKLAGELDLDVEFGMGEQPGSQFSSLVAKASAMITTSVGEGFGLAYLEPWLFGKPLVGRNLPEVTGDFKDQGIALPDLYDALPVPCSLFDSVAQESRFNQAVKTVYQAYGQPIDEEVLARAWKLKTHGGVIDFGIIDEIAQAEVIRSVAREPKRLTILDTCFPHSPNTAIIEPNAQIIRSTYGLDQYGTKLHSIYQGILQANPGPVTGLPSRNILDGFLDINRFNLLRT